MTNVHDGDLSDDRNPFDAALLAMHLVGQVLDEAYVIAKAAQESGQPWHYLSALKNFKSLRLGDANDEELFEVSQGDCDVNENKMYVAANVVATSTPQKFVAQQAGDLESQISNLYNDNSIIGQGDENSEVRQANAAESTSMFISNIFDMSEVEHIVICDDAQTIETDSEPNDNNILAEAMNNVMGSFVINFPPIEGLPICPGLVGVDEQFKSESSDYSLVADAFVADISRDVAFYIDDDINRQDVENFEKYQKTKFEDSMKDPEEYAEEIKRQNDVALYEHAFLTLNRYDDQCSEEDVYPVLQDPKEMTLQEVELITANTSDDNLSHPDYEVKQKTEEPAVAGTESGVSGSKKSTLARRCRTQGARLLACLRGWWRRKLPGKRKESRVSGATHALCPLSPNARRRASSLLDNRLLRSPSPSRPVLWKFNTVNETVVNSKRWKDYTFEDKSEDLVE